MGGWGIVKSNFCMGMRGDRRKSDLNSTLKVIKVRNPQKVLRLKFQKSKVHLS